MKSLILLLFLVLSPFLYLSAQFQRLGLLPTNGIVSIVRGEGAFLKTICTDIGRGAAMLEDNVLFKNVLDPGKVSLKVNGNEFPGGLAAALSGVAPLLLTKAADGPSELYFKLNPAKKWAHVRQIEIKVDELAVLGNKANDREALNSKTIIKNFPDIFKGDIEDELKYENIQNEYWLKSTAIDILKKKNQLILKSNTNASFTAQSRTYFQEVEDILKSKSDKVLFVEENAGVVLPTQKIYTRQDNIIEVWTIRKADTRLDFTIEPLNVGDILWAEERFRKSLIEGYQLGYVAGEGRTIHISSIINNNVSVLLDDVVSSVKMGGTEDTKPIIEKLEQIISNIPDNEPIIFNRDPVQKSKLVLNDKVDPSGKSGDILIKNEGISEIAWINNVELCRQLKLKFPNKHFFIGSLGMNDIENLKSIPLITQPSQITAIVAPKSNEVIRQAIIPLKKEFEAKGFGYKEYDVVEETVSSEISQANVVLISGHKNIDFENYLKGLKDQGILKGKIVAVFSCFEKGTTHLNSYLTEGVDGAKMIIFCSTTTDLTATKAVINEMIELSSELSVDKPLRLYELIEKAADRAAEKPEYQGMKTKIMNIKESLQKQLSKTLKKIDNGKNIS